MLNGRTSSLLVQMLCVINCYLNVIVRSFPCNENKCYLRDEDNCCGSWTWVHFRCSSGTILFFSYAVLAPKFEFEWECERGVLNLNIRLGSSGAGNGGRRMGYFCQHLCHLADPSSRYSKNQQVLCRLEQAQPSQPFLGHPNRLYFVSASNMA